MKTILYKDSDGNALIKEQIKGKRTAMYAVNAQGKMVNQEGFAEMMAKWRRTPEGRAKDIRAISPKGLLVQKGVARRNAKSQLERMGDLI